jgi:hypothetical protein
MLKKYMDVMMFYLDSQEKKNYKRAKEEYLIHIKVVEEFNFFWNFKLDADDNKSVVEKLGAEFDIDFTDSKYQRRLCNSMQEKGF